MLDVEALVLELVPVDGFATSAVTVGEVTSLDHEILDDSVEAETLVTETLLAGAQRLEFSSGPWERSTL